MKVRAVSFVLLAGLIIMGFLAAIPGQTVSAQVCYDAQHPNGYPCPPEEEKKKRTPIVYPSFTPTSTLTPTPTSTGTPTSTPTNTPTPTITPTPTLIFGMFVSGPAQGLGGFTCPPYTRSLPLGAGAMVLGLLILTSPPPPGTSKAALAGKKKEPDGSSLSERGSDEAEALRGEAQNIQSRNNTAAAALAVVAAVCATIPVVGTIIAAILCVIAAVIILIGQILRNGLESQKSQKSAEIGTSALSRGDKKMGRSTGAPEERGSGSEAAKRAAEVDESSSILYVIKEIIIAIVVAIIAVLAAVFTSGAGSLASANLIVRFAGTVATGAGIGLLGSALFGGLLGFDCISVYVVLPAGAALGLLAAIAASLIPQSGR